MISGAGEVIFNKDLYTEKPLVEKGGVTQEWTFAPEPIQKAIGIEKNPNGTYTMNGYWSLAFNFVPALRRFATTAGAFTEQDRTFWSAMLKNTAGINVKKRDFIKEDLVLMDRNLQRSQRKMDLVVRTGFGKYKVNTNRLQGRLFSALFFPTEDKMKDLSLDPEIAAVAYPYMTLRKNDPNKILMTGILKQKLREIAIERFPKEAAFFDTVDIRSGLVDMVAEREELRDTLTQQAKEQFEYDKKNFKSSGELMLDMMLGK
jgi:hypothetical protein